MLHAALSYKSPVALGEISWHNGGMDNIKSHNVIKWMALVFGLCVLGASPILRSYGVFSASGAMIMIALVMALWWISEALPLAVTALVPIVAYPLAGIMKTKEVAPVYMSSVLMLFMGGFLVAIAMQRWNLHKRLALKIVAFFGNSPPRLLLGFMAATGFLSMWISNTASAVMMVSIGLAMIKAYEELEGKGEASKKFGTALMIGIAYSASIGGMATLVGTPPNLALARIYGMTFPGAEEISFGSWFMLGVPTSLLIVSFAWFILYLLFIKKHRPKPMNVEVINNELRNLGPMKFEEKVVAGVFSLMALLWIFRKNLDFGILQIPGWSHLLPFGKLVDDGTVAIFCALVLFMVPSTSHPGQRVLGQKAISEIPWSTILLFGGGFALAKGIQSSGLSAMIGEQFSTLGKGQILTVVAFIALGMSFLTEMTSNMASTEMILPILAAVAQSTGVAPLTFMIPATLAASCAFMLPAATAPNAIIFSSGRVRIFEMAKAGILINLFSVMVICLMSFLVVPHLF